MNVEKVLHKLLKKSSLSCHKSRLKALSTNVDSLLYGRCLSVTGLGRSSRRSSHTKHAIKQSDRLVGNTHLFHERIQFYQAMCRLLVKQKHPRILVDWSDITETHSFIVLRASIAFDGRSFTLYEQVHEVTAYANRKAQHAFLKTLSSILPSDCQPIIISDAGFQSPWFKAVEALGWYWVGRLHGSNHIRTGAEQWLSCNTLYRQATARVKHYYDVQISRKNELNCNLYSLKEPAKFRKKKTKTGAIARSTKSQKYSRRESKPWIIVTNLPKELAKPKAVINLYKTRMQIEESFRDMKSHRFGFSLRYCLSRTQLRYANLLLIAMLASFIALVMGCYAEHKKRHYRYQANTIRSRRVLSLQYLALEILSKGQQTMSQRDWQDALIVLMDKISYDLD